MKRPGINVPVDGEPGIREPLCGALNHRPADARFVVEIPGEVAA